MFCNKCTISSTAICFRSSIVIDDDDDDDDDDEDDDDDDEALMASAISFLKRGGTVCA